MTSTDAWEKVRTIFANKSTTRMLSLLDSITKISKEGKTVSEYMQGIKSISDDLDMIGHPLGDGEIVVYTLNGLTVDFKDLAAAIRARDTVPSFEELHDKLLDHESFLKRDESRRSVPIVTAQFN